MEFVTVGILSFNSSDFILETLDSVFKQTWKNIELIISDDCSTDDTLKICHQWVNLHSDRFNNIEIIASDINTGVAGSANRVLSKASGKWIKFVAADDALLATCIADNMEYIRKNSSIRILFSKVNIYKSNFNTENYIKTTPEGISSNSIISPEKSADEQHRMLLISDRIHFTPSVFLNRDTLKRVGGYDERFKMLEDYPMWLKLTGNGIKLHFMDKITVKYRKHDNALNNKNKEFLINPNYFKQEKFRRIHTYPYLPSLIRLDQRYTWIVRQIFRFEFMNRKNSLNQFLLILLTSYLNPFKYVIFIRSSSGWKNIFKNDKKLYQSYK